MSSLERRHARKMKREEQKKQAVSIQQTKQELSIHSGPLPAPEQLIKYNEATPNAADRIIKMAEKQLEHRKHIEEMAVSAQVRNSTIGILCGFTIGMTTVLCGTALMWHGNSLAGFGSVLAGLASLVGVFLYKKEPSK